MVFKEKKQKIKRIFIIFHWDYFFVKKKFDFVKKDLTLSKRFVDYAYIFMLLFGVNDQQTYYWTKNYHDKWE